MSGSGIGVQCRSGSASERGIGVQCCLSGRGIGISIADGFHWDVGIGIKIKSVLIGVEV